MQGPDSGVNGCHFFIDPVSNALYIDGPSGGGSYIASSPLGAGGADLTNPGICTIHAADSSYSLNGNDVQVNLDVEFLTGVAHKQRFLYTIAADKQGNQTSGGLWTYWGFWNIP